MKQLIKTILILVSITAGSHILIAQKNDVSYLKNVDLSELRKTVIKELLNDKLIESKKEKVHLSLRDRETQLNGKVLTDQLHTKYGNLALQFDIARGSYRTIYLDRECTAVGDFYVDSFVGKSKGKLRLKEVIPSAQ